MEEIRNKKANNEYFVVDGRHFIDCEFVNCTFAYCGGHFKFSNCTFTAGAKLEFKDAASRTVDFMNIFSEFITGGQKIPKIVN